MNKLKQILFTLFINILAFTWRIKVEGNFPASNGVIIFWHCVMLPCWYVFKRFKTVGVVSQSKDGTILSALLESWNYDLIRGSSSTDSKQVLDEIIQNCTEKLVLITPDGPRGPVKELKAGAFVAAARTKSPLYYLDAKIYSSKVFRKSWDKFELPLPFSKIEIKISSPVLLENDRDIINNAIAEIQQQMNTK